MPISPVNPDSNRPSPAAALPLKTSRKERQVRNLILDYALGISILGLIPIPRLFTLKLVVASSFIFKMTWDIGKMWRFRKGQDLLAIAGVLFGNLGALAMAAAAWLTFFGIGVFLPYLKGLAFAAALFTLSWAVGQAVSQFYASGYEKE
jgi:hypothetical protein